ncbi:DUF748 domain-containing protein [Sulfurimonas sp.]|nr:DUF748 domain-containing protein [Sulfurimonas sp.]
MFKKIVLSLILFYTLVGFVAVPLILKPQIIDIVAKETNAKIEIDSVFFNPYAFYFNISGLKLSSLDDKELVYIKEIFLNIEVYSLFNSAVHLKNFVLEEPRISLVIDQDKKINFASIAKPKEVEIQEDTNTTTEIPRIILDRIAVINGSMNYEDYSRGSKFELGLDTIGFELKDIDTNDLSSSDAKVRFYTLLSDGGFIDLKSEVIGFEPLVVKGSLGFEASKLYTQWRYIENDLNLEVADGKLSLNAEYHVNLDDLQATTISNVNVNLDKLRVKPKGNKKDVLTLNSLSLENATIKPLAQDVHVAKIGLHSLNVFAKRDTEGNIDWLEYIKVNTKEQVQETVAEKPVEDNKDVKPWNVLVDAIALEKIKVNFIDDGIKPSVQNTLNELNIFAQNVTLAGEAPLDYQMNLTLNDQFVCSSEGSVIHKVLDASSYTKCSKLDITHFLPYIDDIARKELDVYNVKLRSLMAGFDANLTAKDINSSIVIDVNDANLHLNKFALNKRSTNKRLVTFSNFDVRGIKLNTATKLVNITDTTMKYLNLRTARLADGTLSTKDLILPKVVKKVKTVRKNKRAKKEEPYRVQMKKVALKGAKISFVDKMLDPSVASKIDNIYLSAYNVDSKKYSWMKYYLSARVNGTGKIKTNGSLRHTPLRQKGSVELNKLVLKDLNPYIDEHAFVYLKDGYLSLKTKTQYNPSSKNPDLSVNGSFKLDEFFVHDSRDDSALVSFNKLDLKSFTLETQPNRLFVNEIDIDSFFVSALIDANKTMNLATLVKGVEDVNGSVDSNVTEELALVDANLTAEKPKEAFPVKIMKVNVTNGNAVFADASLPINFKTDIHDLNGVIYSISSNPNETTFVDIVGEVDEYGSTKLKGSVNAANPKAYTDINFNFKNLDLSAMSGYSATFAGYKIDNGKLFLDLNYDIKESALLGENSIIVKNIELGDTLEVEGGSSLPLGFVIGLLEDSDGVIDIDMPIRGNVDEPDFKYGALVWKTLGNLILKAVASPFSFLGSMLGIGGDELKYAEFEAGSLTILPAEREKLDNIAKLLIKRPKMDLSIAGSYSLETDTIAMKRAKLADLVVKLSGAKNEEEKVNAMNIDLLEDIFEDMTGDDDKIEKIEDALEEKYDDDEKFERAYLQALVKECSAIQVVTPEELQTLAKARSTTIKSYLVDAKEINIKRIQELEIVEVSVDDTKLIRSNLEVVVK